ncbi:MAG: ATP-binding protein [Candidatus Cloacimonetes bacterium]|nr:ATP-binding protein [Candidatus Cloacimonadota bacterium]
MRFVNRESEMELLNSEYLKQETSFVVIYGRRRTGKTTLIEHFLKDKNSLYFFADTQNENTQIKRLQELMTEKFNDQFLRDIQINNWDALFDYLCQKLNPNERFVLAIDEFQSLVKSNEHFSSIFQRIYDAKLKHQNIMIILCGSLISMMYSETLAYSSPLYGRRTAQIKLKEIDFSHYHQFYQNLGKIEQVEYFSVTGGIPKYIELFQQSSCLLNTIKTEILNKNKYLYYEPRFLLQDEVSDVSTYFSILTAIAAGNHKLNTITSRMGVQANQITAFLKKLIDLDIIEKQVPITEYNPEKSKKGLYFIKDHFLQFWFRFVFPYQSYLEIDNLTFVENKIKNELPDHVAHVFETLSVKMMYKLDLPFVLDKCGRWWDKNTEIDVIGVSNNDEILFGECKWSENQAGLSVLKDLQAKTKEVQWGSKQRKEYFILFSKAGFTEDLIQLQKEQSNLFLLSAEEF